MYFRTKVIFFLVLIAFVYWIFLKPVDLSYKTKEADQIVGHLLNKFKVGAPELIKEVHEFKKARRYRFETVSKTYSVSFDFPFDSFREELHKQLRNKKIYVLAWEKNRKEKVSRIDIGFKHNRIYILFFRGIRKEVLKIEPVFKKAKVAIVIDDFGYNLNRIDSWLKFEKPITFSVLPNLSYSTRIANQANIHGKEIILHLPLEPHHGDSEPREPSTVTTNMSSKEISKILDRAIKTVPYLKGVSNHQGSKATEDSRLMEIIFRELKQKNLFFLDSLVTSESAAYSLASQMGLRFAQRDVFLDNINEIEYIKSQLNKLAEVAQARGFAIGIGHARGGTLEALQLSYPALESKGIEFVYLSELVK